MAHGRDFVRFWVHNGFVNGVSVTNFTREGDGLAITLLSIASVEAAAITVTFIDEPHWHSFCI